VAKDGTTFNAEAPGRREIRAQMRSFSGCRGICRNEANWRRKWLRWHGDAGSETRVSGPTRRFGGLEVLEGFEGAEYMRLVESIRR